MWFSPFTCDLTTDELLDFLADCAGRAERVRANVFVTGAELTLFTTGFLPGDTHVERLAQLRAGDPQRLNDFLARAVAVVRERFSGKVSYAALPSERVDWAPFDFVGVDLYRSVEVADIFDDAVRRLVASGKPVAITEFGCTTHRGAADLGARGAFMVEWDGATPVRLRDEYLRDEDEQAEYLRELLDVFTAAGVDTAFVHTFACYHLPEEFDVASYGVVKVLADSTWVPKAAFSRVV